MDIDEDKKEPEEEKEGIRNAVSDEEKKEEKPIEEESVEETTEDSEEESKTEEKAEEKLEEKEEIKPVEEVRGIEKKPEEKAEKIGFFARLRKAKPKPELKPETGPELKPEIKLEKKPKPELPHHKFSGSEWYDRNYKKLLYISLAILIASIVYIFVFNAMHGDIMYKDVTLTGGTVITVYTAQDINIEELEAELETQLSQSVSVRTLEDITTRKQIAVVVETRAEADPLENALENFLGFELSSENSNIEISGASLSKTFYKQLGIAIFIAFIFMAIVVFIIFKTPIPSLAVVVAALTDIAGALAIANLFGFKISTAGIAAFLMLIGYSVDTDIMLTTKVIKRKGEGMLNTRIWNATKTGLVMTLTSFVAVLVGFFVAQSPVLKQIFFILSAGLFIDLISTWFGNTAILKWYCKRKKIS